MCLQAHQCSDQAKKAEIVKEVQSIVLNSEKSKDDIRDCGGVQALCRLLSLSRNPLVLQHVLASLASLSFDNASNCDEVTSQGGLQTMCSLLGKTKDSAVQESIAWALKNLAATERNQNEARTRGGLRALCELLKTTMDDKVLERVTWAIGSLVDNNTRNCQAVQDCGGVKTMCELVSLAYSENVLERTIWALGNLAMDMKNRNFIRQYGGLENICKKLQELPSQQIIKQGAMTLKTLASSNHHNKDVMVRLGMISSLRSLMTNEQQGLGIIPRRVCGDLLQRLLGSAAGNIHTSSTATAPDNSTQECSITSGVVIKQEPETRAANGLMQNGDVDSEEDDDLPSLGGEDSDEKNERFPSATITPPPNTSENLYPREIFPMSETQRSAVASSTVSIRNHAIRRVEENDVVPYSVHPKTVWSQTRELVRVCVKLRGVERQQTEITTSRLKFSTQLIHVVYELDIELSEEIDPEQSKVIVKGSEVQILLKKRNHAVWKWLLKSKEKLPYVSVDFDRWEVWSSSEEDEADDDANLPTVPTNPNNSHHTSGDNEGRKVILLPEMLVSDSESNSDETLPSDVDCLEFY